MSAAAASVGEVSRISSDVDPQNLRGEAARLLEDGYRLALVAAHDDGDAFRIVYLFTAGGPDRRVELSVSVGRKEAALPSLAPVSFPASRFEREIHDLFGIVPEGHPQPRRLVLHQHWPESWFPMRSGAGAPPPMVAAGSYPFVPVEGDGVYEIPVGPVHAGLIEPGHFRFWVIGETIVRMKARLWFVHKGIEKLFEGRTPEEGLELAERISGDSAVGHSLAYCLAVEEARGTGVDAGTASLRALLLEMERLHNHVADIGALCNDVAFGIVQANALALRETLLRLNAAVTGHRLLRGAIRPGGSVVLRLPTPAEVDAVERELEAIVELAISQSTVRDRFSGTAILTGHDARQLGVVGFAARASGLTDDCRTLHPFTVPPPFFRPETEGSGDVLARFRIRVAEARTSLALIRHFAHDGAGSPGQECSPVPPSGAGVGIVEGWRGATVHRIEIDPRGRLSRVKVVDPSFFNWPALPVSLAETIVPDFPLANKSFNLSYAGNDL